MYASIPVHMKLLIVKFIFPDILICMYTFPSFSYFDTVVPNIMWYKSIIIFVIKLCLTNSNFLSFVIALYLDVKSNIH